MVGAGGGWLAGCANECARDEQVERGGPWWWNGSTGKRGGEGICKLAWLVHSTTAAGVGRCGVGWRSPALSWFASPFCY